MLVSHAHWDHLDVRTLARIGRSLPVVTPARRGAAAAAARLQGVIELDAGEETRFGTVVVRAVPAEHDASRGPLGLVAGARVRDLGSRTIYFAGDTDLFEGMTELAPAVDAALLPVTGWGPRLPPGHLDPHRAAIAASRVPPTSRRPDSLGNARAGVVEARGRAAARVRARGAGGRARGGGAHPPGRRFDGVLGAAGGRPGRA